MIVYYTQETKKADILAPQILQGKRTFSWPQGRMFIYKLNIGEKAKVCVY